MCMFSGPVRVVADTTIFARRESRTQFLAYQMRYQATKPVAIILPIPVALPAHEDSVRFIDLKDNTSFFTDLADLWPSLSLGAHGKKDLMLADRPSAPRLRVASVGDFVASFVPTLADFERLDPRFRLPRPVWDSLPRYRDFGFVVFQLQELQGTPHPMSFSFPTRLESAVFYPTVHVHDGHMHPQEHFDHLLYLQAAASPWEQSPAPLRDPGSVARSAGLLLADQPIFRQRMRGIYDNEDVLVSPVRTGLPAVAGLALGTIALGGLVRQLRKRRE